MPTAQIKTALNGVSKNAKSLVDVLIANKVLTQSQGDVIKLAEVQTGETQEQILKDKEKISAEDLVRAKAELYNVQFIDLATTPVSPEAVSLVSQDVAERFKVFPVSIDRQNKILVLAMSDPLDLSAIGFIEQKTSMRVKPVAAVESKIEEFIATKYSNLVQEVTDALNEVNNERKEFLGVDNSGNSFIREEKVSEIVSHVLDFAMRSRASDVHIEPLEKSTRVRYRIDGILQEKITTPKELHEAIISRIKILSAMKIDEKRIPQDGRFNFKAADNEVDLRVSTLPTSWGEKVVMRLLKKSGGVPDLQELGLRGRALKNLEDSILRPHGIILICGPTGSGKTTTLYSIISKINTPKVNIMTLEDPIEYKIPGVNQVQINPGAGLTFASGLRSFLRQDPNIILVGEIRDKETADLAIQASLTGHLVFSTLHTNDASGALPRMLDMGAEPYLLASSITAIVAQRVVRKIHEPCKVGYKAEPKVIENMKNTLGTLWPAKEESTMQIYKGEGDQECGSSGYYGRVGIFEVLPVSEKISRLILERSASGDIEKAAREEGMISLMQDGYLKVIEGITTIDETLRVAQE